MLALEVHDGGTDRAFMLDLARETAACPNLLAVQPSRRPRPDVPIGRRAGCALPERLFFRAILFIDEFQGDRRTTVVRRTMMPNAHTVHVADGFFTMAVGVHGVGIGHNQIQIHGRVAITGVDAVDHDAVGLSLAIVVHDQLIARW